MGAFIGIGALSLLNGNLLTPEDNLLLIGSLGASAVLVYGAPRSPLAQPRNLVGGHLLSATVGVLCYLLLSPWLWLAAPLAVAVIEGDHDGLGVDDRVVRAEVLGRHFELQRV